ncbi:hypothetical protein CYY_003699 [Polysphondylium violaceum]|uniref:Rab-GAP TBC domain-containing protein n=1 Tax=Polysphondylium violaceum TaxID=133409 RepID=A0A8J4PUC3_9MYCE|nr:hypothetical protein CYY_003699 [Polysphondylium violaceum]
MDTTTNSTTTEEEELTTRPATKLHTPAAVSIPLTTTTTTTTTHATPMSNGMQENDALDGDIATQGVTISTTSTTIPSIDTTTIEQRENNDFQEIVSLIKENNSNQLDRVLNEIKSRIGAEQLKELLNTRIPDNNLTLLYYALVLDCYNDLVLLLLLNGSDPNQMVTPLPQASSNNIVLESPESSSSSNSNNRAPSPPPTESSSTINSKAYANAKTDTVEEFYKKPASLEAAIHYTVRHGDSDKMNLLIDNHADKDILDSVQRTPLILASSNGRMECVRCLVLAKCNITLKDILDKTALHVAIEQGYDDISATITSNGGDISLRYHYKPIRSSRLTFSSSADYTDFNDVEILKRVDRYGNIKDQPIVKDEYTRKKEKKSVEKELSRCSKWLSLLKKWNYSKITSKVKSKSVKGVPPRIRCEVWSHLSHSNLQEALNPNLFETLVNQHSSSEVVIDLDVNRAFRGNIFFRERYGVGQVALFNVLKVYSLYDTTVGYTQGMSSIASVLCMYLPEKEAFWTLERLMNREKYSMRDLFLNGLPKIHKTIFVFDKLFVHYLPNLSKHFESINLGSMIYATKWFIIGYLDSLPFNVSLRIWDLIFVYGYNILYSVAICLLRMFEKQFLGKAFENCYEVFRSFETYQFDEDEFINFVIKHKIKSKKIEAIEKKYVPVGGGSGSQQINSPPPAVSLISSADLIQNSVPLLPNNKKDKKKRFSFFQKK